MDLELETSMESVHLDDMSAEDVRKIRALIQVDLDAMHVYGEALDRIEKSQVDIRSRLVAFQEEHDRHVRELSEVLQQAGIDPPERKRDFTGLVLETVTALRASLGTEQALRAIRRSEKRTIRRYTEASSLARTWPAVAERLRRAGEDERRHLDYIERALAGRIWEGARTRT